jgi:RNA polymerase sigma factor (sigma-70 family)
MDRLDQMTPEAFSATYERHLPAIVRYLGRRLGDGAAEDAAAEVFIRAFRQCDSYEARTSTPLPWLYAIAGNVISESRRAERRRLRTLQRLASEPDHESTIAFDAADRTLSPRLARALRRLKRIDRDTLLLIAWGELSYAEAAVALAIPVGTVRSRLVRARAQLDRDLAKATQDPDQRPIAGEAHV